MEKISAITDATRLPGVPIETRRIPNAHVRRGLSQNVALRVLEGLKPVNACHENPKTPAQAVEERTKKVLEELVLRKFPALLILIQEDCFLIQEVKKQCQGERE
ncbi:hypothetical protein AAHA92_33811 [Salvia divinorum]|uniref:Uncharacterized protein n=1 Tax=Salvia divinorum TaxID=28513 RepID=A0ABD1FHH8_SALDI